MTAGRRTDEPRQAPDSSPIRDSHEAEGVVVANPAPLGSNSAAPANALRGARILRLPSHPTEPTGAKFSPPPHLTSPHLTARHGAAGHSADRHSADRHSAPGEAGRQGMAGQTRARRLRAEPVWAGLGWVGQGCQATVRVRLQRAQPSRRSQVGSCSLSGGSPGSSQRRRRPSSSSSTSSG